MQSFIVSGPTPLASCFEGKKVINNGIFEIIVNLDLLINIFHYNNLLDDTFDFGVYD
jgi:hypothetical protein